VGAPTVDIVGFGRLGQHVYSLFQSKGIRVRCVYSSTLVGESSRGRHAWLTDTDLSPLVFLCIPDDQLEPQLQLRAPSTSLFLQCSGAKSLVSLPGKRIGVWYPLQSFSLNRSPANENWPVFLEADSESLAELQALNAQLGLKGIPMNSQQRQFLHLAAVWGNNFGQLVMGVAKDICESQGLDPQFLKPLLQETAEKALDLPGEVAQTGPARRNDQQTQALHLDLMQDHPDWQSLYKALSESIQSRYRK